MVPWQWQSDQSTVYESRGFGLADADLPGVWTGILTGLPREDLDSGPQYHPAGALQTPFVTFPTSFFEQQFMRGDI